MLGVKARWLTSVVTFSLRSHFPWCAVRSLMESVASMDDVDRAHMSESFGETPWEIDSAYMTWCRRPRLYWTTWELLEGSGAQIHDSKVFLEADVPLCEFLLPGWEKVDAQRAFPTFTTSRPRAKPGHRPAGLQHCSEETVERWKNDDFRYPPYQYSPENCLKNSKGEIRMPNISEKEMMMGLPVDYTHPRVR